VVTNSSSGRYLRANAQRFRSPNSSISCQTKSCFWTILAIGHNPSSVPVQILAERGINLARIRTWVDPDNGICGREATLNAVKRTISAGIDHMITDFHYSDTWADPGKQDVPGKWLEEANEFIEIIHNDPKAECKRIFRIMDFFSKKIKKIKSKNKNREYGTMISGPDRKHWGIPGCLYKKRIEIMKVKMDLLNQLYAVLKNYSGLPEEDEEIVKIKLMEFGFDYTIEMCDEILRIKRMNRSDINLIYQLGNEIIYGTLWPYFKLESGNSKEYENLARFFTNPFGNDCLCL